MHAYKQLLRDGIHAQKIQLSITNIRALKSVCRRPQSTAHSVAQRMQRDKAQITRALNDLIDAGLIKKVENPTDRRSQLLEPTSKGKKIKAKLDSIESQAVEQLTHKLAPADLEAFLRISQAMADNVEPPLISESKETP
ncbi:transcriptional regulator, MarR family [gamma proteobacterium NOR5-3]|nr:transcriptional regulator, MarR family [gamma proteobacterium NOR5-3]